MVFCNFISSSYKIYQYEGGGSSNLTSFNWASTALIGWQERFCCPTLQSHGLLFTFAVVVRGAPAGCLWVMWVAPSYTINGAHVVYVSELLILWILCLSVLFKEVWLQSIVSPTERSMDSLNCWEPVHPPLQESTAFPQKNDSLRM